jgi:hypothetical protein
MFFFSLLKFPVFMISLLIFSLILLSVSIGQHSHHKFTKLVLCYFSLFLFFNIFYKIFNLFFINLGLLFHLFQNHVHGFWYFRGANIHMLVDINLIKYFITLLFHLFVDHSILLATHVILYLLLVYCFLCSRWMSVID